jgi:hypothetical protein
MSDTPDLARYMRYARAVTRDAAAPLTGTADAVMTVADAELADLRAEVARLRVGEDATPQDPASWPTPGQFIHSWNGLDAEARLETAANIVESMQNEERLRVACTEFEDAYVGEHEDRVKAEAEVERLREDAEQLRDAYGMAFDRAADAEAEVERVRGVLRDAYGKLWNQAEADHARADAAETKVRAVEALADRVPPPDFVRADGTEVRDGCRGHIDVRDLRTALAVVPPGVTPPDEPCPYEVRYALHSNGMKCCDEDGAP